MLKIDQSVENVCIDLLRRFVFKATDTELNDYVTNHMEVLNLLLRLMDPRY